MRTGSEAAEWPWGSGCVPRPCSRWPPAPPQDPQHLDPYVSCVQSEDVSWRGHEVPPTLAAESLGHRLSL